MKIGTNILQVGTFERLYGVGAASESLTNIASYKEYKLSDLTGTYYGEKTFIQVNDGTNTASGKYFGGSTGVVFRTTGFGLNSSGYLVGSSSYVDLYGEVTSNIAKSFGHKSILRNLATGVIQEHRFYEAYMDDESTNTGTTDTIKAFYMKNHAIISGSPAASSRWGIYIDDNGYNYIKGRLGLGSTSLSDTKFDVVGYGATSASWTAKFSNSAVELIMAIRSDKQVQLAAGIRESSITTTAVDLTVLPSHYIIIDTAGVNIQLPNIADVGIGTIYKIRTEAGNSTILSGLSGADNIDGGANLVQAATANVTLRAVGANTWRNFN